MIGHLRGSVLVRDALTGTIVLDVGGVGYQLTVSWQTFAERSWRYSPCQGKPIEWP